MNINALQQQFRACWRSAGSVVPALVVLLAAGLAAAQEQPPVGNPVDVATLPRDLSPWGMFIAADNVVKAVMIGLALASVATWTVWLAKTIELIAAKRRLRADLGLLAARQADTLQRLPRRKSTMGRLVDAAATELQLSESAPDKDGIKERILLSLARIEKAAARRILRGTGVLATIGATAPFVGLFGTVWGIMNSFFQIGQQNNSSLAVVAPGISEALFATAIGLFAAIPAVIAYNRFSHRVDQFEGRMQRFADRFHASLSRELEAE